MEFAYSLSMFAPPARPDVDRSRPAEKPADALPDTNSSTSDGKGNHNKNNSNNKNSSSNNTDSNHGNTTVTTSLTPATTDNALSLVNPKVTSLENFVERRQFPNVTRSPTFLATSFLWLWSKLQETGSDIIISSTTAAGVKLNHPASTSTTDTISAPYCPSPATSTTTPGTTVASSSTAALGRGSSRSHRPDSAVAIGASAAVPALSSNSIASASASASAHEPLPASSPNLPKHHRPAFFSYHHSFPEPGQSPQNRLHKLHKRQSHLRNLILPLRPASSPTSSAYITPVSSTAIPPASNADESEHRHDDMAPESGSLNPPKYPSPYYRTDSLSSTPGTTPSNRGGIMTSHDTIPSSVTDGSISTSTASNSSRSQPVGPKPLIIRNNRTYIHDPSLPYPLPVDLAELHRQSLRTLLLFQLFRGPIISQVFTNKPPARILEVGCGSAFWSMMCHRYFAQHGHSSISFTGIDIVPLAGASLDASSKPDKDMRWKFVQHDIRRIPWPLPDEEFDLIMVKDMSLASAHRDVQTLIDEYIRLLKPGGVLEIWDTDSSIRMLRPHVLKTSAAQAKHGSEGESGDDEEDDASVAGAYVMTTNTPLSAPLNPFLVEYNSWVNKALESRGLSAVPCTFVGPQLLQESDALTDIQSKRLAVPLSEIRWEREGVGGVVTKDGKSYIDSMKGKSKATDLKGGKAGGKGLNPGQAALRRTALETTTGLILSLEPILKEASGKSQDEWDGWTGKMMNDLLREGGTTWGECLEVGAWTARKRPFKKS
ncbi:hypothetical protein F4778DRAFT_789228 [Xylariomycetidae sp. FL2044]|nr:hypothetical protein F4778DRAFT_789228 [Xylariomycetidae sp. FL2044]